MRALPFPSVLLAALLLAGCAPRLGPLYRDFAVPPALANAATTDSLHTRAAAALRAAGWTVEATAPEIRTSLRDLSSALVYRNQMRLQAFSVGPNLLRVQFQPVRRYTARTRTFLPYLPAALARRVVPDVEAALRQRGFTPVPSGPRKDQRAR